MFVVVWGFVINVIPKNISIFLTAKSHIIPKVLWGVVAQIPVLSREQNDDVDIEEAQAKIDRTGSLLLDLYNKPQPPTCV